jgi:integrase/recombinase XerD
MPKKAENVTLSYHKQRKSYRIRYRFPDVKQYIDYLEGTNPVMPKNKDCTEYIAGKENKQSVLKKVLLRVDQIQKDKEKLLNGIYLPPEYIQKNKRRKFKTVLEDFLKYKKLDHNLAISTLKRCSAYTNNILDVIKVVYLDQLSEEHLRTYLLHRQKKVAKWTIYQEGIYLRSFAKYCLQREYLNKNPFIKVKMIKPKEKTECLTEMADITRFLDEVKKHYNDNTLRKKLYARATILIFNTGMRLNESNYLQKKNIFPDYIRIGKSKTASGEGRPISLFPEAAGALRYIMSKTKPVKPEDYIFPDYFRLQGGKNLYRFIKNVFKVIGFPKFSTHTLRHTIATFLLNNPKNKLDIRTVQDLLGHKSVMTTQRYTHPSFERQREDFKKIGGVG